MKAQVIIEMPTNCNDCPLCYDAMECSITGEYIHDTSGEYMEKRHITCPLKEIEE